MGNNWTKRLIIFFVPPLLFMIAQCGVKQAPRADLSRVGPHEKYFAEPPQKNLPPQTQKEKDSPQS